MSTLAPAPPATPAVPQQRPGPEACPLCGTALAAEQEWCLRCGAAARTRLAAAPNWKMPFAAVAVVAALSLGVLAAALVKLAGETGPPPPAITRTVAAASPLAASTATAPPTATAPAATPGGVTAAPGQSTAPGQSAAAGAGTTPATPTSPARAPSKKTGQARQKQLTPAQQKTIEKLNLSGKIK